MNWFRSVLEAIETALTGATCRELDEWAEAERERLWRTDPEDAKLYGIRKPRSMRGQ